MPSPQPARVAYHLRRADKLQRRVDERLRMTPSAERALQQPIIDALKRRVLSHRAKAQELSKP